MILRLDFANEIPIYLQIRNQIVVWISTGVLKPGEQLPTIRNLAAEAGINTMTVNKAYAILKQEGFISMDRRKGTVVNPLKHTEGVLPERLNNQLKVLISEARIQGMSEEDFLALCQAYFKEGSIC